VSRFYGLRKAQQRRELKRDEGKNCLRVDKRWKVNLRGGKEERGMRTYGAARTGGLGGTVEWRESGGDGFVVGPRLLF